MLKIFVGLLEYLPLWIFIRTLSLLEYNKRVKIGGFILGYAVRTIPRYKNRILQNIAQIYPNLSEIEKNNFLKEFSQNLGLTFTEFLFNDDFHANQRIDIEHQEQLNEILTAKKINQPVIIVSGHFGPWEAVRALLKRHGMETGALYRRSKNIFYQPYHHKAISAGGEPLFQAGRKGTGALIRHLKKGGIVCIMIDQAVSDGHYMDFMGQPAKTTLSVANMAIRYNALLIPAYAIRTSNKKSIQVILEPSIPFNKPIEMTKKINKSLGDQINSNPTQWYWVHNRWK